MAEPGKEIGGTFAMVARHVAAGKIPFSANLIK